jgi:hypothetical protein
MTTYSDSDTFDAYNDAEPSTDWGVQPPPEPSDADRLLNDFNENPHDTFLAVASELYGDDAAQRLASALNEASRDDSEYYPELPDYAPDYAVSDLSAYDVTRNFHDPDAYAAQLDEQRAVQEAYAELARCHSERDPETGLTHAELEEGVREFQELADEWGQWLKSQGRTDVDPEQLLANAAMVADDDEDLPHLSMALAAHDHHQGFVKWQEQTGIRMRSVDDPEPYRRYQAGVRTKPRDSMEDAVQSLNADMVQAKAQRTREGRSNVADNLDAVAATMFGGRR